MSLLTTTAQGYTGSPNATLENGLANQIAQGILNFVTLPVINGRDAAIRTPYVMNYNLSIERAIGNNMSATVSYVGNVSRHIETELSSNPPEGLETPGTNTQSIQPFPAFTASEILSYSSEGNYNSLQAKLQKRYSNGMEYLGSYTWSTSIWTT